MATTALPRKRGSRRRWWLIAGALLGIGVLIIAALQLFGPRPNTTGEIPGWTTTTAQQGTIEAAVSATGTIAPEAQAEVRFLIDGTVTEILVTPGDLVKRGQALARVDPVDAELKYAAAQADLELAQAGLEKTQGGATKEELQDAESKLAQAQAQYQQTLAKFSNADIVAARARVEQAQVRLNQLRGAQKSSDVRDAEAALERAKLALQAERDRLSQAKTNAQIGLDRAVADLSRAQQNYATAKANWEFVDATGQDPTNPEYRGPDGKQVKNKLNDTQRQQYYDAFVSAESGLRTAEANIRQSQVDYDAARQSEITGVQSAEQQVASAQAALDKVRTSEPAQVAEARAALASAQADLNRLIGASRASDLAAAQASVDAAQQALDRVKGGASSYDLAKAQADLSRAETAVRQAQRALDQTTLVAPYDATVAKVDMRIGEQAAATAVIGLVDLSGYSIEVPIDELDVPQIQAGQLARIAVDALPGVELTGRISTIAPLAVKSDKGTNTYAVTVQIDSADINVRPGMTASVQVVTTSKQGVVLVPRRAIQTENGKPYVQVKSAGIQAAVPAAVGPGATTITPGERRAVTLGLSNSEFIEITSGLQAGETVYVPDIVQTVNPFGN